MSTHPYTHTRVRAHTHTYICARMHIHTYTHARARARTHAHTHTHTHTHVRVRMWHLQCVRSVNCRWLSIKFATVRLNSGLLWNKHDMSFPTGYTKCQETPKRFVTWHQKSWEKVMKFSTIGLLRMWNTRVRVRMWHLCVWSVKCRWLSIQFATVRLNSGLLWNKHDMSFPTGYTKCQETPKRVCNLTSEELRKSNEV